jgi:hypothetical protein
MQNRCIFRFHNSIKIPAGSDKTCLYVYKLRIYMLCLPKMAEDHLLLWTATLLYADQNVRFRKGLFCKFVGLSLPATMVSKARDPKSCQLVSAPAELYWRLGQSIFRIAFLQSVTER